MLYIHIYSIYSRCASRLVLNSGIEIDFSESLTRKAKNCWPVYLSLYFSVYPTLTDLWTMPLAERYIVVVVGLLNSFPELVLWRSFLKFHELYSLELPRKSLFASCLWLPGGTQFYVPCPFTVAQLPSTLFPLLLPLLFLFYSLIFYASRLTISVAVWLMYEGRIKAQHGPWGKLTI